MGQKVNLVGQRFGSLVVEFQGDHHGKFIRWVCRCDCGRYSTVGPQALKSGHTTSCGCQQYSWEKKKKHGGTRTLAYNSYKSMLARCYASTGYKATIYKDKGIKVCDRWRESFTNFYEDMGERPSKEHTLDRIDGRGDYTPHNCRWATKIEQANNTKSNLLIVSGGEIKTASEWAREIGVHVSTIYTRIKRGLPKEKWLLPKSENFRPL